MTRTEAVRAIKFERWPAGDDMVTRRKVIQFGYGRI